jgi:hypothetical protein
MKDWIFVESCCCAFLYLASMPIPKLVFGQAIRDVERDILSLDGMRVSGGEVGYAGVCCMLVDRMRTLLPSQAPSQSKIGEQDVSPSAFNNLFSENGPGNEILTIFASALLRTANRTESGHWSFSMVCQRSKEPSVCLECSAP